MTPKTTEGQSPATRGPDLASPPPLELGGAALFLDIDGTIAPIMQRPEDVAPIPRRTEVLRTLRRALKGRLAILSGRTLEEVDRILDSTVTCVAAIHGLVRRDATGVHGGRGDRTGLARARSVLERLPGLYEGVLLEDKELSLAVHYRLAPQWKPAVEAHVAEVARQTGLWLQGGSCVVELRAPGAKKGDALATFMASEPFRGSVPVMVGDDLTDEDAFAAAQADGGFGVLVGPQRPTAARYRLTSVGAVLEWLEDSCGSAPRPAFGPGAG